MKKYTEARISPPPLLSCSRSLFQSSPFYPYRARATSLFRSILLSPGSLARRERGVGTRRKWKGGEKLAQGGFLGEKKRNSTWPAPSVYEVVPKKVNGADFEESLFPPLQCKIRGNGHRSINHATRVHARFDDGFKWFHVDRFRFLPWRKIGLNPRKVELMEWYFIIIYIFQCVYFFF